MPWSEKEWNHNLLSFYQKLIHLRRTSPILQHGGFQILSAENDTIIYQREAQTGRILIVAHRHHIPRPAGELPIQHAGIPDSTQFQEYFSGQSIEVSGGKLFLNDHPRPITKTGLQR